VGKRIRASPGLSESRTGFQPVGFAIVARNNKRACRKWNEHGIFPKPEFATRENQVSGI
jgi:hypothetical protein